MDVMDKVQTLIKGVDLYDLYRMSNDVALSKESQYGEAIVGG